LEATTSSQWTCTLDLAGVSVDPPGEDEALRLACDATSGTLGATGRAGDCLEMQFDETHSLVLYMSADHIIHRPHFPNRESSGQGVEDFFCKSCGVQLGERKELLSRCMTREEGFRVCREILRGQLPETVAGVRSDQTVFPSFESLTQEEAKSSRVEWVPLRPRHKGLS
jgi:hypothetical protein